MVARLEKKIGMFLILLFAVIIQFGFSKYSIFNQNIRLDALEYLRYGWNISHEQLYSKNPIDESDKIVDLDRPPVYPLFIATVFQFTKNPQDYYSNVIIVQNIIRVATVLLYYLLMLRLCSVWLALVVATLVAFDPAMLLLSQHILSETLLSFFLVATVYLFCLYQKTQKVSLIYLLTFILTLLTFTHLSYGLIAGICVFFIYKKNKKNIVFILLVPIFLGGTYLNYSSEYKDRTKLENVFNRSLVDGMFPDFENPHADMYHNKKLEHFLHFSFRQDEIYLKMLQDLGYAFNELKARVAYEPEKYLIWYFFKKPNVLWNVDLMIGENPSNIQQPRLTLFSASFFGEVLAHIVNLCYQTLLCVSLAGFLIYVLALIQKSRHFSFDVVSLMGVLMLYLTCVHVVFVSAPRYSVPFHGFVYSLGIIFLSQYKNSPQYFKAVFKRI